MLRRGEREADKQIIEVLIGANDRIGQLVSDLEQHQKEKTDIDDLVKRVENLSMQESETSQAGATDKTAITIGPEFRRGI